MEGKRLLSDYNTRDYETIHTLGTVATVGKKSSSLREILVGVLSKNDLRAYKIVNKTTDGLTFVVKNLRKGLLDIARYDTKINKEKLLSRYTIRKTDVKYVRLRER